MLISERIFSILEEQGMTQKQFSELTGISQSTISDWKHKKINPAADKILVICEALQVTPYALLSDSESERLKQLDYVIVDKDSADYMILETVRKLSSRDKIRLEAYLQGLTDKY